VRDAFGRDCDISTLQEPVAAALNFIVSAEAIATPHYTLGVFDFGGGTTDITLLIVDNLVAEGYTEIRAEPVSSTGTWFGGEDLTSFVFRCGLERCLEIARKRDKAEILIDPRQAPDQARSLIARQNRETLLHWAEVTKLLLVRFGDDHLIDPAAEPPTDVHLNVVTAGGLQMKSFQHAEIVPRQLQLYEYLESELSPLAGALQSLVQRCPDGHLDYLLLSGKSSAIPLVEQVLQREFPGTAVKRAQEPKECVVSGACILEKFQDASDILLTIIGGGGVTISRIGMEDVALGGMRVFRELFPAGVPIPAEGLSCRRPLLLHRRKEVRLLENDGEQDALWVMGKQNQSISELATYVLRSVPDWLPQSRPVPATLELRLTRDFAITLTAHVEERAEAVEFICRTMIA
jgi:hypothetical protein